MCHECLCVVFEGDVVDVVCLRWRGVVVKGRSCIWWLCSLLLVRCRWWWWWYRSISSSQLLLLVLLVLLDRIIRSTSFLRHCKSLLRSSSRIQCINNWSPYCCNSSIVTLRLKSLRWRNSSSKAFNSATGRPPTWDRQGNGSHDNHQHKRVLHIPTSLSPHTHTHTHIVVQKKRKKREDGGLLLLGVGEGEGEEIEMMDLPLHILYW